MSVLVLALLEEHANAGQVKACLEECGHEVIVVNTFTKALELLDVRKIDLIISDVHLENGGTVFDFMRHVKRDKETTKIPFVLYSHQPTRMAKYLADGLRTTSRMLGAALYIEMESFDATEFRKHIESVLTKDTHEYR